MALDNFGTGSASLTHLLDVPVDTIKIDHTIISRLRQRSEFGDNAGNHRHRSQSWHDAGCGGVETEVQAGQLLAMGCRLGQGKLYSSSGSPHRCPPSSEPCA
ncbi:EAL domain-containing protein [Foliimonas ilicis]